MLCGARQEHVSYVPNRPRRVQAFGTHIDASLNTMAAKDAKRVGQASQTLIRGGIASVSEKTVGL